MPSSKDHQENTQRSLIWAASAFFKKWLKRILVIAFILAIGTVIGGFFRFTTEIAKTGQAIQPNESADGIIALTGGQERIKQAVSALGEGRGKRLLITGVNRTTTLQAIARSNALDISKFTCCVDIDHTALDTIGNAAASANWAKANNYKSLIIVTSNVHMIRSLFEFKTAMPGTTLIPLPVSVIDIEGDNWLKQPQKARLLLMEYGKYIAAISRQFLGDRLPNWVAEHIFEINSHTKNSA